MAEVVLGVGTSHSPMLSLDPEHWGLYEAEDRTSPELVFPPEGVVRSFDDAVERRGEFVATRSQDPETFREQHRACNAAIAELAATLTSAAADITVIISDDQDEWFYEHNMPSLAVYWGESATVVPRRDDGRRPPQLFEAVLAGYGDRVVEVPVARELGRHLIDVALEHDFDVAHLEHPVEQHGGRVVRRYPTETGESDVVRESPLRPQGLPHGFSFVVKRLFHDQPRTILPVFLNTCYPPNQVRPGRAYDFGRTIAEAIRSWPSDARVAVVASGGLSHFVVDEEVDRLVLDGLARADEAALRALPRHRLFSATSEILNWVALGGAMASTALEMELLDYVPVYRSAAGTGGGWAFARWT